MKMIKNTIVGTAFLLGLTAVADSDTHKSRTGQVGAKGAAYPTMAVDLETGKQALSQSARTELRDFVNKARANKPINQIYVAVFADRVRPADNNLPEADQELARERGRNIREFLENDLGVDVTTVNMAKQPGWWARTFDTRDARMKGDAAAQDDWVAQAVRNHGKPSVAVVVAELERS